MCFLSKSLGLRFGYILPLSNAHKLVYSSGVKRNDLGGSLKFHLSGILTDEQAKHTIWALIRKNL